MRVIAGENDARIKRRLAKQFSPEKKKPCVPKKSSHQNYISPLSTDQTPPKRTFPRRLARRRAWRTSPDLVDRVGVQPLASKRRDGRLPVADDELRRRRRRARHPLDRLRPVLSRVRVRSWLRGGRGRGAVGLFLLLEEGLHFFLFFDGSKELGNKKSGRRIGRRLKKKKKKKKQDRSTFFSFATHPRLLESIALSPLFRSTDRTACAPTAAPTVALLASRRSTQCKEDNC